MTSRRCPWGAYRPTPGVFTSYRYLVVSRKRHREFDPDQVSLIKANGDLRIQALRRVDADPGEVELYCHSSARENKERGIAELFAKRFEADLQELADGKTIHIRRRHLHSIRRHTSW